MTFDKAYIQRVREAADIVEIVSQDVVLKRSGVSFIGNCPFHADTKRKLSLRQAQGDYRCWSCGAKGDAITWLMEREHLNFPQAVEKLARRYGIPLPQ